MTDKYYPSVQISERPFLPSTSASPAVQTSGCFIGLSSQGPTEPTLVTSWASFTTLFGTMYTDLHFAVSDFFLNGGRQAYVTRIPGDGAVAAELEVFDTDATDRLGTPLFTVTANNPGTWGNQLRCVTAIRDATSYRFDVAVYRVPVGETFDGGTQSGQYLIDQWLDVSLDPDSPRYFYAIANAPSQTGSQLVTFSGQSYDPEDLATRPMPAGSGHVAYDDEFTGGTNGVYSGAYDADVAYAAALAALEATPGPLIMNLPGTTDAGIVKSAVTVAGERGDTFVVVDTPGGLDPAGAITYVNTSLNLSSISYSGPSYAGVYYPHVHLPVIGSKVPGRTSLRAPGGAVAGVMQATDYSRGAWKAPAGLNARITGAIAIERKLSAADLTTLNNNHVNAIRSIIGTGVVIMGARTVKKVGLDRYVNVRRAVIEISETLKALTEFAIFENNDERLWGRLTAICSGYLASVWQAQGLRGTTPQEAFYVKCDATNNSAASIEQGTVNIEVGIAPQSPAEFIIINIGQFDGGSSASVSI